MVQMREILLKLFKGVIMGRPLKRGNDYFPIDVDMFEDIKIRILLKKYGSTGFYFFIVLLTNIYREGYCVLCDDDFKEVLQIETGLSPHEINTLLQFFIDKGFFDKKLYEHDGVLTSRAIQLRYQEMIENRAKRNHVTVDRNTWLLSYDETKYYINGIEEE